MHSIARKSVLKFAQPISTTRKVWNASLYEQNVITLSKNRHPSAASLSRSMSTNKHTTKGSILQENLEGKMKEFEQELSPEERGKYIEMTKNINFEDAKQIPAGYYVLGASIGIMIGAGLYELYNYFNKEAEAEEPLKLRKRVVILGTGWAALSMVRHLDSKYYDVIIISPRNYFLFTPLLPSTTVGTIDVRSIVEPIRSYCKRMRSNAIFYEAAATDVDFEKKVVTCVDSSEIKGATNTFELNYDYLVVAVGSVNNTFGTPGVEQYSHFLKEAEDAVKIRQKITDCFETASLPGNSEEERKRLLSFLVVGGGPTGVEFAGELYDFLSEDVRKLYPSLVSDAKITLVQSGDHLLNTYDLRISEYTEKVFQRERINVLTNTRVLAVNENSAEILNKTKNTKEKLPFGLCVWSTGIASAPLVAKLCGKLKEQTHSKVLITDSRLRVKGAENVYALGDCSTIEQRKLLDKFVDLFKEADVDQDNKLTLDEFKSVIDLYATEYPQMAAYAAKAENIFREGDKDKDDSLSLEEFKAVLRDADSKLKNLPATAQVAAQQGQYLGKNFNLMATSHADPEGLKPFNYKHLGSFAYVGSNTAVADVKGHVLGGILTWWLWRGSYWSMQQSMRNKMLVATDWIEAHIFGRDTSRF